MIPAQVAKLGEHQSADPFWARNPGHQDDDLEMSIAGAPASKAADSRAWTARWPPLCAIITRLMRSEGPESGQLKDIFIPFQDEALPLEGRRERERVAWVEATVIDTTILIEGETRLMAR